MNVLIAGSRGYIGSHVTALFRDSGLSVSVLNRDETITSLSDSMTSPCSDFEGFFDVVINCARPHWSEYSAEEIVTIERVLLGQLDRLASKQAIKIHTSGVWLFGKASPNDLLQFNLKPFIAVKLDEPTIKSALNHGWHIVYCPSLVYGGENCQLQRIIETYPDGAISVATPSLGFNQYIHVVDVAKFYLLLAQGQSVEKQYFIAEQKGYSPKAFSQLLLSNRVVKSIAQISWEEFESRNGLEVSEIERLNLDLPISPLFEATESIANHIEKYLSS